MNFELPPQAKNELKRLGLEALYVFGSRAQGLEGPLSDYDFAVLLPQAGHSRGDALYNELYDILSPLCPRQLENDVIDIVFLRDAALELRFHVVRYGKVLYDDAPLERSRFEETTTEEYCDYRPLLNIFDQALLASI